MERIPLNKHLILRHGSLEFEREDITIYMLTHNLSIVIRPARDIIGAIMHGNLEVE